MGARAVRNAAVVIVLTLGLVLGSATTAQAANRAKVRRPGPLRALLVGDSITASYQDEAAALLEARGYQVSKSGLGGTGLLDVTQCRGDYAQALLTYTDPDIVVGEWVGNNGTTALPICAPPAPFASAAWYRDWKKSARLTQKILMSRGARFLWVLAPAVSYPNRVSVIPRLNAIYRQVAGQRAGLVDAWTGFGVTYNPSLHVADGIHLNQAGQNRLAALVAQAVA
jgi:hypothetical protein